MSNLKFFVTESNKYTYLVLFFFFTCANTEVNEETGHVEEQWGEKQGEEVKAGLSDCVSKINN